MLKRHVSDFDGHRSTCSFQARYRFVEALEDLSVGALGGVVPVKKLRKENEAQGGEY